MTAIPGLWTPPRIWTPRKRWRPTLAWMMANLGIDSATGHLLRQSHLAMRCPTTVKPKFTCLDKVDVQVAPQNTDDVIHFAGGNHLTANTYRCYVVEGAVQYPWVDSLWRVNAGAGTNYTVQAGAGTTLGTTTQIAFMPGSFTGYATVDLCTAGEKGACAHFSSSKVCENFDHPGGPIGIGRAGGGPDPNVNCIQGNPSLKFMLCRVGCEGCLPGLTPTDVTINFSGVNLRTCAYQHLFADPGTEVAQAFEGDLNGSYDLEQTATWTYPDYAPNPARSIGPCSWTKLSNASFTTWILSTGFPDYTPQAGCPGGPQKLVHPARIFVWRSSGRWWVCVTNYGESQQGDRGDCCFAGVSEPVDCDTVVEIDNLIINPGTFDHFVAHCGEFNLVNGWGGTVTIVPSFS